MDASALSWSSNSLTGSRLDSAQSTNGRPTATRCFVRPSASLQTIQGRVVSTSMMKTAVIQVDRYPPHPLYGKRIRQTKKYFAHDEAENCVVGDLVEIQGCRPISKNKVFMVHKVLQKSDL